MAFVSAQKSRLLVADFSLSPKLAQVRSADDVDMLDYTTLTDTSKVFLAGQDTSTFDMSGYLDVDSAADEQFDQLADWKSASPEPVSWAPSGLAVGAELLMVNALESSLGFGAQVADRVTFSLGTQTDGRLDFGVSLHDLGAETASSNSTAHDGTAATSNGGVGHLHVTAFTGLTNIVVKVQHSTNNSTWADLLTFTTVTGLTAQRSAVTGTVNRYLRTLWTVTGTGSATFCVALARR